MSLLRTLLSLKYKLIKHGPNTERGFSIVTGGILALGIIALSFYVAAGRVGVEWLGLAYLLWGAMWVIGPLMQPSYAMPVLQPAWFSTLSSKEWRLGASLTFADMIGVGPLITAIALSGVIIIGFSHSTYIGMLAVVATILQLYFLIVLGKVTAALVRRMLRGRFGTSVAALQMSLLLSVSFAGWVPIVALFIPNTISATQSLPLIQPNSEWLRWIAEHVALLPTNWSLISIEALQGHNGSNAVLLLALLGGLSLILHSVWLAFTVSELQQALPRQTITPRKTLRGAGMKVRRLVHASFAAVMLKEFATWLRDPMRSLELWHAWLTPVFMLVIIGVFTSWYWALPFIGVGFALFGTMVAVNTYALDGTALWQQLTVPKALRYDILARQFVWIVLFGIPAALITFLLIAVSASPLYILAIGMTLTSLILGCALGPLTSLLMPAIGTDARLRIRAGQPAGDATGGQMTAFTFVLVGTLLMNIPFLTMSKTQPLIYLLTVTILAILLYVIFTKWSQTLLVKRGQLLFMAFKAKDIRILQAKSSHS